MIANQNLQIYVFVLIYFLTKVLCYIVRQRRVMTTFPTLSSIPERKETEEDPIKWVPKKKHEVLKAKYKCLKKLFQIYDASVIGILPDTYADEPYEPKRRRKRSRRTKTDACAGTTEVSNGDVSIQSENTSIPTAVIRELSQMSASQTGQSQSSIRKDESTQDSKENVSIRSETTELQAPPSCRHERRKPTRFQCFLQRIFGLRPDRSYHYKVHSPRPYAASDNDIVNRFEKRRRRGLRLRRGRRPKKVHSDIALKESRSPVILNYVQSVQRSCLMDTTPRQCPIVGCRMMFYGIINYNDHLNLCHFPQRRHVCHYCHAGFELEDDKFVHENEHLGLSKLNARVAAVPSTERPSVKIASITQTDPEMSKLDVPEDKLKKIVSFFDKLSDPEKMFSEMRKNHYVASLQSSDRLDSRQTCSSEKTDRKGGLPSEDGVTSRGGDAPVRCQLCGEQFNYRRQLSLHVDVEHRNNERFSKFHSCAGIMNTKAPKMASDTSETSQTSKASEMSKSMESSDSSNGSKSKCLAREPSADVMYYTSLESLSKKSATNSLVQKVRSGFCYKWEPGTKIIRV